MCHAATRFAGRFEYSSDAIAASNADLFSQDDCVILIAAGERVQVIPDILREICLAYVVTKHARETADGWVVEYRPYEPDEMTLRALLITAKTFKEGSLACRLPKAPGTPVRLSEHQVQEIKYRLSTGEPADLIAQSHRVNVETVRQLGARRF